MAVRVDSSSDALRRTANLPSTTAYFAAGWAYIVSDLGTAWQPFLSLTNTAGSSAHQLAWDDGGNTMMLATSTGTTSFSSRPGTGTWFYFGIGCDGTGSTALTGYWIAAGSSTVVTASRTGTSFTPNSFNFLMDRSGSGEYVDARGAYLKLWDTKLTQDEWLAQMYHGRCIVQRANLRYEWPLLDSSDSRDLSGQGFGPTLTSLTTEDGPPIRFTPYLAHIGASAVVSHSASGTPSLAKPTASGAATRTAFSTGTPSIAKPTASGAAVRTAKASGSPSIALPTASGAATAGVKEASGAPSIATPTASGVAFRTAKASGSPAVAIPTTTGAAFRIAKATGAPSVAKPTASGAATRTAKASGAVVIPFPTASGTATVAGAHSASGSPSVAQVTASGSATVTHQASGAIIIPFPVASGEAEVSGAEQAVKPAGKRKRRKYFVEIDGQEFQTDSVDEAEGLLELARYEAENHAQRTVEIAAKRAKVVAGKVTIKVALPKIKASRALAPLVAEYREQINEIYRSAVRQVELSLRIKIIEEDEEDALVALLFYS